MLVLFNYLFLLLDYVRKRHESVNANYYHRKHNEMCACVRTRFRPVKRTSFKRKILKVVLWLNFSDLSVWFCLNRKIRQDQHWDDVCVKQSLYTDAGFSKSVSDTIQFVVELFHRVGSILSPQWLVRRRWRTWRNATLITADLWRS